MLKMHQKRFGGRAPPGPARELKRWTDRLAAIWGLLLREGKGGKRKGGKGKRGKGVDTPVRGRIEGQGREREERIGREGGNWGGAAASSF